MKMVEGRGTNIVVLSGPCEVADNFGVTAFNRSGRKRGSLGPERQDVWVWGVFEGLA